MARPIRSTRLLAQRPPLPASARATAQPGAPAQAVRRPGPRTGVAGRRAGAPLPHDTADLLGDRPDARWTPARAELATASSDSQAQTLATVHPAAVPLVRQQLDALATDQFRWAGEAWRGAARLDDRLDDPGNRAPHGDGDTGDGIAGARASR